MGARRDKPDGGWNGHHGSRPERIVGSLERGDGRRLVLARRQAERGGKPPCHAALVDAKAPEDAAGFKAWLRDVAQKAAEAGNEGGFLGFGGVAVSDAERATLAEISTALGSASG